MSVTSIWDIEENKASKYTGTFIGRNVDGEIDCECNYLDGMFHGHHKMYQNKRLWKHSIFRNGKIHGEMMWWFDTGGLYKHEFYRMGENITAEIEAEYTLSSLTKEDKLMITMKWGIPCL